MPHDPPIALTREELERRCLFERDGVVVIDKPWGLPSTGRTLDDPDCLQFALTERHGGMVWAVHQLDADTSGLNVFVYERRLVPYWQERMRFPNGEKTYIAVVHGEMAKHRSVVAPIGLVSTEPSPCLGVTPGGRAATTRFRVLDRRGGFSLLRVRIETGRTHQIRIHAASIGHPLVGEFWYIDAPCRRHVRQALHAWELRCRDGAAPGLLRCPLAPDLVELIDVLGFRIATQQLSMLCNRSRVVTRLPTG